MDRRTPWFFYAVGVIALTLSAATGRLPIDPGLLIAHVAFVGAVIAAIQSIQRPERRASKTEETGDTTADTTHDR